MSSSQEQKAYQAQPLKILILANARYKGGISGGDAIYESFKKYWPCDITIQNLQKIDYKPFLFCYLHRFVNSMVIAIFDRRSFDMVYSSSDFFPDSISAFIYRIRGYKWLAGFYLKAFKENKIHYYSQKIVKWLINKYADMVIVTNPTMYDIFPDKKKTWINGGIDLKLAGLSDKPKFYDAVFCGRIHPSKGIDELVDIWVEVLKYKPNAKLAVIGDGDLGKDYIKYRFYKKGINWSDTGVFLLGYMGDERYEVYKESKVVLYPTPLKYDHFSMAPVEAMACGCSCLSFNLKTLDTIDPKGWRCFFDKKSFAYGILNNEYNQYYSDMAMEWAQQFDYEQQSLRVYNDIKRELFNESISDRGTRDGGNDVKESLNQPLPNNN